MSFQPSLWDLFGKKKQKTLSVGKIRKYDKEKVFFFEEKTFSSFKIAFLPKWEGTKYTGGSRPSCCFLFQTTMSCFHGVQRNFHWFVNFYAYYCRWNEVILFISVAISMRLIYITFLFSFNQTVFNCIGIDLHFCSHISVLVPIQCSSQNL